MAGIRIEGSTSGNVAEVTANNEMKVALGTTPATMGGALIFSENDAGAATGSRVVLSPETSDDYRLRVGLDTILLSETFNYAAQNSGAWSHILTTMTITNSAAGALLNASNITTVTTGAMMKSYRRFPIVGAGMLYGEAVARFSIVPVTNEVIEIGFFDVAAATTVTPLDGVFFRIAGGNIFGVLNNNASEVTTGNFTMPTFNVMHKFVISVNERHVDFWIDDVLQATIDTPVGNGQPFASGSSPFAMRVYNAGVAPSTAIQLLVSRVTVSTGDYNTNKSWSTQMSGQGLMSYQGAGGMTQGTTANMANSAAPASATLSNTAAGYTTLGGQWQFVAVAGAETDYALFAYQVPAATAAVTGRTLFVTGVSIDTFNTVVAVATTATVFQWSLGFGSTAVSLATAEAAATKAPRRFPLGVQSFPVAAAVGAAATPIVANFEPVAVNAGEFLHIILKMPIGTATATEIFRGTVRIQGFWE
jgi:hypothetical protein